MKFRKLFDLADDRAAREHCDCECQDDSLTVQGPAQDADINVLVRRFGIDRAAMPVAPFDPSAYGDLSDVPDLGTALLRIKEASDRFAALPPLLRRRFGNDPVELWEFVNDPQNGDEAVSLGLLQRLEPEFKPEVSPAAVPPVMPEAAPPPPVVPPKGAGAP